MDKLRERPPSAETGYAQAGIIVEQPVWEKLQHLYNIPPAAAAPGSVSRKTQVCPCQHLTDAGVRGGPCSPHNLWQPVTSNNTVQSPLLLGLSWSLGSQERVGHGSCLWEAHILQAGGWITDEGAKSERDSAWCAQPGCQVGWGCDRYRVSDAWDTSHVV